MYRTSSPVASLRKTPDTNSEQVSQTFFGEGLHVIEQQKRWIYVQTEDGYYGWLEEKHGSSDYFPKDPLVCCRIDSMKAHLYSSPSIYNGPIYSIPLGASIAVKEQVINTKGEQWFRIGTAHDDLYLLESDTCPLYHIRSREEGANLAKKFLHHPYTWGGRSSLDGFDCSGFVQMIYKEIGISLPRDAKDQIRSSHLMPTTQEDLKPCDLIFWENKEGNIVHVALSLQKGEFIHATASIHPIAIRKNQLNEAQWNGTENLPKRYFLTNKATH
jgi:hypothetical protein